jgi:hypothetical protein
VTARTATPLIKFFLFMRVIMKNQSIYEQSFSKFICGLLLIQKAESRGLREKNLQTMDSIELVQETCLNQQNKLMTVCARWYGCCHGDREQASINYIFSLRISPLNNRVYS